MSARPIPTAERTAPPVNALYDVAIVGGGPAGLSAALWLARYLHSVILVDSGDPRNWETRGINGFLGSHGIRSPELRARGRDDARSFGAELVDDTVSHIQRISDERFRLTLDGGRSIESRRVLLAIGIKDKWPRIPGLDQCYGETAHVCPDCDGYETRDRKTVVIGKGRKAVGMALALTTWTPEIVVCTNGEKADIEPEDLKKLEALNIPVLENEVVRIRSTEGEIRCIELANGMQLDCERLYFAIGQRPADEQRPPADLGEQLGLKRDENDWIIIDDRNHTSVRSVFAAGDIVPGPQLAVAAAAGGAIAALAIHKSLLPDERKLD